MAKNERKKKAFLLKRVKTAGIVISLFIIIAWAASPMTTRAKQHRELAVLKQKQRQVRRENRRLHFDLKRLKTDEAYWEELARTNLGYIKGDEEAYVVIEEKPEPAKQSQSAPEPGLWEQLKEHFKKALAF